MSDVNQVVLSGRLTRDAELRYTGSQDAVCDFTLASNQYSNGTETTLFVDVTVWKKQAESLSEFLVKGAFIIVQGRLKLNQWESDGQKRSKLTVVAERITLGPKSNGGGKSEAVSSGAKSGSTPVEHSDEDVPF